MKRSAMIFPTPLKSFFQLNKDQKNTDMSSTESSNLVSKRSSFADSCREFTDSVTIFRLLK